MTLLFFSSFNFLHFFCENLRTSFINFMCYFDAKFPFLIGHKH